MTLQQFKNTIQVGDNIIMLSTTIDLNPEVLAKQKKMRTVSYKDTTGFYLRGISDSGKGSFCAWPKASELTINGDHFTIKDAFGERVYQIIK